MNYEALASAAARAQAQADFSEAGVKPDESTLFVGWSTLAPMLTLPPGETQPAAEAYRRSYLAEIERLESRGHYATMQNVPWNLRRLIDSSPYTKQQLADHLGISYQYLYKVIREPNKKAADQANPSLAMIAAILHALGADWAELDRKPPSLKKA